MTFSGGLQKVAVITNVAQEHRLKRIGETMQDNGHEWRWGMWTNFIYQKIWVVVIKFKCLSSFHPWNIISLDVCYLYDTKLLYVYKNSILHNQRTFNDVVLPWPRHMIKIRRQRCTRKYAQNATVGSNITTHKSGGKWFVVFGSPHSVFDMRSEQCHLGRNNKMSESSLWEPRLHAEQKSLVKQCWKWLCSSSDIISDPETVKIWEF